MSGFFVYLSPDCYRLSNHGKDYTDAYILIKQLSAGLQHPILLNFKANKDAHRIKLRIGVLRFNRLLKYAIANGLAKLQGDHLHLIGHNEEKHLFNRRRNNYKQVPIADIKRFIQAQIIIHKIKAQKYKIAKAAKNENQRSVKCFATLLSSIKNELSKTPNLSARKAGELLNLSHTQALNVLSNLKSFGLTIKKSIVNISEGDYQKLKKQGIVNARYNKETGDYYYLGANHFILCNTKANYTKTSFGYCDR
jgi:hypothetical protein